MHTTVAVFIAFLATTHLALGEDRFNYDVTDWEERNFGPPDWDRVQCENIRNCPGYLTNWDFLGDYIDYDNETPNRCIDCSSSQKDECQFHKQSPIDLYKEVTKKKRCKDRHRMNFNRGNCRFGRMRFEILPHVLRAYQNKDGCQINPCIDFSMGFPNEWLLRFTDISVPSQHTYEGRHFAGEVVLSHVLGVNKTGKEIGNVVWFLEEGTESDFYFFLELYIRRWQFVAERIKEKCDIRRNMKEDSTNLRRSFDDARDLETVPAGNMNITDPEPMEILDRGYFDEPFAFHPYEWYIRAGTNYYFRYEGTTTEPPCVHTTHWRVMRLPITVAPSQIRALEALLAERIDPITCEAYTAGRPRGGGSTAVDVNRPIQTNRPAHKLVYCECVDWDPAPRFEKDIEYCELSMEERGVFEHGS